MFTGLVEEVGIISAITHHDGGADLSITAQQVLQGTVIGDSIAVNGACLTVTSLGDGEFTVHTMAETLRRTSVGHVGGDVNLERAMRLGDRLGGHLVTGHVDAVGTIRALRQDGTATVMEVECQDTRLVAEKGSVCLDGVSLTVVDVWDGGLSVSLIPHTLAVTALRTKTVGDQLNIEYDLLAKHVARLMGFSPERTLHT